MDLPLHKLGLLLLLLLGAATTTFGHQGKTHKDLSKTKNEEPGVRDYSKQISQINSAYQSKVKLIFKKKCFDCHSKSTHYPWYYKIPGVRSLIDKDIKEGLEHMDLSSDFPFTGHGSPIEDLKAIEKSVTEGSMPLWSYRMMHSNMKITEEEKTVIQNWIRDSQKLLEGQSP